MVRVKHRYLLVNILYPELDRELEKSQGSKKIPDVVSFNRPTTDVLNAKALLKGIRETTASLFGDYGSGAISASLAVKYLSPATSTFILKVSRAHYNIAWAALSMMSTVPVKNGNNCVFRVVRVSGTMRLVERELIRRTREIMLKVQREMAEKGDATLDGIFGTAESAERDVLMVDNDDREQEDEDSDEDSDD